MTKKFTYNDLFEAFIAGDTEKNRTHNHLNEKEFRKEMGDLEIHGSYTYDDMYKSFIAGDSDEMRTSFNSKEDFENWITSYLERNDQN